MPTRKRVAAYARVSSAKEAMLKSLSAQVSHYSNLIQNNPEWEYVGVYADEAMTGTKENRAEFQSLLKNCREGKIDLILTKSISRFARNTIILLETIRELKALKVEVYFENENIHSLSGDGELMLTILASFAQAESLSVSENCKWRIRKNFEQGIPNSFPILGYRLNVDTLQIVPEEAEIVRTIFTDYLGGMGKQAIVNKLNAKGIKTKRGNAWNKTAVDRILKNEKYIGDMLLQKVYVPDHINKIRCQNEGQLPKYYVKDSHMPIIDRQSFDKVQKLLKTKAAKYNPHATTPKTYPFSGKILCSQCQKSYHRKINNAGSKYAKPVWICSSYNRYGKGTCSAKQIPEDILISLTSKVLGILEFNEDIFKTQVKGISAGNFNRVIYIFHDGRELEAFWQDKSRKWSKEAKQLARKNIKGGKADDHNSSSNYNTTNSKELFS